MIEHLECDYETINENNIYFVLDNGLSIADLEYLCHLGVGRLQDSNETLKTNYQATRNIHCAFIEYCIENNGTNVPTGYSSLRNSAYLHYKYQDRADEYVYNEFGIIERSYIKDGDEFPVYECPECDYDQLVYDAEANKYHCFHCSEDFTSDQLFVCSECNRLKYRNGDAICTECADVLMAKKD